MPRQRKPPHRLTTDEALRRLFHPHVVKHLKRLAADTSEKPVRKSKSNPRKGR